MNKTFGFQTLNKEHWCFLPRDGRKPVCLVHGNKYWEKMPHRVLTEVIEKSSQCCFQRQKKKDEEETTDKFGIETLVLKYQLKVALP